MKLTIAIISAVSFSLTCPAPAADYAALAANGYRWVTIHGPYASTTEHYAERLTDHRSGATEAEILEDEKAYYLIPGTIVQVIKEDPANGMSQGPVGRFRQLSVDIQPISQQAPDSGHVRNYRDASKLGHYPKCNYAGNPFRIRRSEPG